MKLYLNDKERSLDFLNLIELMLKGSDSMSLPKASDIYEINGVNDPIREFLDYYISDSNQSKEFDEGRIRWITNALYSAKGAPQIFDIFQESFDIIIEYNYEFPIINITNFGKLVVSDVVLFINKFRSMIYHLLYYTELSLVIEELILNVSSILTQYDSIVTKGFTIKTPTLSINRI